MTRFCYSKKVISTRTLSPRPFGRPKTARIPQLKGAFGRAQPPLNTPFTAKPSTHSNPTNYADPTGLDADDPTIQVTVKDETTTVIEVSFPVSKGGTVDPTPRSLPVVPSRKNGEIDFKPTLTDEDLNDKSYRIDLEVYQKNPDRNDPLGPLVYQKEMENSAVGKGNHTRVRAVFLIPNTALYEKSGCPRSNGIEIRARNKDEYRDPSYIMIRKHLFFQLNMLYNKFK